MLYTSYVKRKYGLDVREHYNISNNKNKKVLKCSIEKEGVILDTLRHFKMIYDSFSVDIGGQI